MYALPPAVPASTGTSLKSRQAVTPTAPAVQTVAPTVVQTVAINHTPSRTDLLADVDEWTWSELRDYVVAQIIERFGPFPRDQRKEASIFKRFLNDYGRDGIAVAKFAFGPNCDGWWGRAPISINRFCKASDPYFVKPILERLTEVGATSA